MECSWCAKYCTRYFTNSEQLSKLNRISFLKKNELRLRNVKQFAKGHPASTVELRFWAGSSWFWIPSSIHHGRHLPCVISYHSVKNVLSGKKIPSQWKNWSKSLSHFNTKIYYFISRNAAIFLLTRTMIIIATL